MGVICFFGICIARRSASVHDSLRAKFRIGIP